MLIFRWSKCGYNKETAFFLQSHWTRFWRQLLWEVLFMVIMKPFIITVLCHKCNGMPRYALVSCHYSAGFFKHTNLHHASPSDTSRNTNVIYGGFLCYYWICGLPWQTTFMNQWTIERASGTIKCFWFLMCKIKLKIIGFQILFQNSFDMLSMNSKQ